jgi:hypothetical protein
MALQQIKVPHVRGYDFGIGADRLSGAPMNQVVQPTPSPPMGAAGSVQSFTVSRVQTTHDLQKTLGIDIEASYGCASFGAGASGRFSFMESSAVHSSSLFMTVTATLHQADMSIDTSVLTAAAAQVAGRQDVFTARYGDMFCRSSSRGGMFVGVMRIETYSETDANTIEAELKGSYGLFSAEAATNFSKVTSDHRASVYCSVYSEGGPPLHIGDPTSPAELLTNANAWMTAMHAEPDRYSVPYEWTLSPVAIAEGPLPLNAEQVQHAQDVLQFCARERTTLLDQLNLLAWIHGHPERFDWTGAATPDQLTAAFQLTQADFDLVAACGSNAIDNPAKAVLPASYATERGTTYRAAPLPTPLPAPTAPPAPAPTPVPSIPVTTAPSTSSRPMAVPLFIPHGRL